jgi:hypothetical protein
MQPCYKERYKIPIGWLSDIKVALYPMDVLILSQYCSWFLRIQVYHITYITKGIRNTAVYFLLLYISPLPNFLFPV